MDILNKNTTLVVAQRDNMAGISKEEIKKRFLLPCDAAHNYNDGIINFPDMDYNAQTMLYNCFSADTEFVTDSGVKKFSDFYNGDIVKVQDINGEWRLATVRYYGKKEMNDVTLVNSRTKRVVTCTPNHRWILSDGTVTTELKVGDELIGITEKPMYKPVTRSEKRFFALGFAIGSDSDYSNKTNGQGVRVKLCGRKKWYSKIFTDCEYRKQINEAGEIELKNKKEFSKHKFLELEGWKLLTLKSKIALFNGLYAACGTEKTKRIFTHDHRVAKMIEDLSSLCGYYISSRSDETVYLEGIWNRKKLITFRFMTEQSNELCWKVEAITPHYPAQYDRLGIKEKNRTIKSWCVEEPITNSFTLSGGIITGNCSNVLN